MDNNFNELLDFSNSFDRTGLGRLNVLLVELAERGLRQLTSEDTVNSSENSSQSVIMYKPSEVAESLKISVRTLCDLRKEFRIEPEWGSGKDARYSRAQIEQFKAKMKERGK